MRQWRLIGVLGVLGLCGAGVLGVGPAGAAGSSATLSFNSARQVVEMSIPSGPCPSGATTCTWMLYVNEPGVSGQPTVAEATGTSGTLAVPYPPNFCGVIQADALVGPGSWVYQTGTRQSIHTCPDPVVPPIGGGGTQPVTPPSSPAPAPTSTTSSITQVSVAASLSATPTAAPASTTLPFTGTDTTPFLLAGLAAVAIGVVLLVEPRTHRGLRWLTSAGPVRRVGSFLDWFIGH